MSAAATSPWVDRLEPVLASAFQVGFAVSSADPVRGHLLEVSWVEHRPLTLPPGPSPSGIWHRAINWLLRFWPACEAVQMTIRCSNNAGGPLEMIIIASPIGLHFNPLRNVQ